MGGIHHAWDVSWEVNIIASHTKLFSSPQCSSSLFHFAVPLDSRPLCIGFCALHQRISTFLLWPLSLLPSVLSKFSCNKRLILLTCGAPLLQTAQLLPNWISPLLHLSSAWASFFPLMEGRPLRDHQYGALLRHFHSDSETHFYLFTVNSYRWQPAVSGHFS